MLQIFCRSRLCKMLEKLTWSGRVLFQKHFTGLVNRRRLDIKKLELWSVKLKLVRRELAQIVKEFCHRQNHENVLNAKLPTTAVGIVNCNIGREVTSGIAWMQMVLKSLEIDLGVETSHFYSKRAWKEFHDLPNLVQRTLNVMKNANWFLGCCSRQLKDEYLFILNFFDRSYLSDCWRGRVYNLDQYAEYLIYKVRESSKCSIAEVVYPFWPIICTNIVNLPRSQVGYRSSRKDLDMELWIWPLRFSLWQFRRFLSQSFRSDMSNHYSSDDSSDDIHQSKNDITEEALFLWRMTTRWR